MERIDEHEILVEYSEMTSFDFNSEEFQKVKKDFIECRDFVSRFTWAVTAFINRFRPSINF